MATALPETAELEDVILTSEHKAILLACLAQRHPSRREDLARAARRLNIDRDRASALGVSIEDISRTMQIMFGGLDLSRIKIGGKEYEVIAQLGRESRLTPQSLDQLYVRNASNSLVQLSSVVSYRSGSAPNTIEHYNRLRSATISATPIGVPLGTAVQRVEEMLRTDLPQGFL